MALKVLNETDASEEAYQRRPAALEENLQAVFVPSVVVDSVALEYRLEQSVEGDDHQHDEVLGPKAARGSL